MNSYVTTIEREVEAGTGVTFLKAARARGLQRRGDSRGVEHNVINTSTESSLKLHTSYSQARRRWGAPLVNGSPE